MHSDLDILGGPHHPIKYPPFPEAAWGELLRPFKRRPAAKSMRGTRARFDVSALIIAGVSTGEER